MPPVTTRAAALPTGPDRLKDLWIPLGPATVLGGQGDGLAHITGRVREVEVSPNGLRVYAATANGGVWYSSDQGSTWMPVGGWAVSPTRGRRRLLRQHPRMRHDLGRLGHERGRRERHRVRRHRRDRRRAVRDTRAAT